MSARRLLLGRLMQASLYAERETSSRILDTLRKLGSLDSAMLQEIERRFARLADLEDDFNAALHRAKMASLKALAYGASHEINNPLANISTRAQALLIDEKQLDRRRKLATIAAQAFRAHEMISDLMLFANPPGLEVATVDVAQLVTQLVDECRADAELQQTFLVADIPPHCLTIPVDRTQLSVAIKALIRNALEALRQGGEVVVAAAIAGNYVEISVRDNGPGIPAEMREHLFDPFFSGREAGRGLGFGLCKVWRIAESHGGFVGVESDAGCGSTFRLQLPTEAVQAD